MEVVWIESHLDVLISYINCDKMLIWCWHVAFHGLLQILNVCMLHLYEIDVELLGVIILY